MAGRPRFGCAQLQMCVVATKLTRARDFVWYSPRGQEDVVRTYKSTLMCAIVDRNSGQTTSTRA